MSFLDKAKDLVEKNAEKVEHAIDKAGDFIDEKTGGKYKDAVDKVQDAARHALEKNTEKNTAADTATDTDKDPTTDTDKGAEGTDPPA